MAAQVLIQCESIGKSFGVRPLFESLNLVLHEGDRVGLIGPNGAGKSTLLKILAGIETPDSGERSVRRNLRVGYVPQNPTFDPGQSAEQAALAGLADLEHIDPAEKVSQVALALSRVGFDDPGASVDTLSGGWRSRLAIARELAREPAILLLDEPTNHLDVESIVWLENWLAQSAEAFVVVSHDRYFLEKVANTIVDLNPAYEGGLLKTAGTYSDALEASAEKLRHQDANREVLANRVRREVEWLRRGAKARTSKSKSRIQAAETSIRTLAESNERARTASAGVDFSASGRKTKRLWYGKGLCKAFGERKIFDDLELLLTPKSRLGVLGPNGSGKTTLLRTIVGELKPDAGSIRTAEGLRVAYFDQRRDALDPDASLRRALAPDGDSVVYLGREVHVVTWAHRFLFRTDQLDTPVSRLSGGERARIHLARLMLQPADLLVLDEPTNDLDIDTLDVLEDSLSEFPGAVVLVTHDRHLLDRVTTQLLALDGTGKVEAFASVDQWLESRRKAETAERRAKAKLVTPRGGAKKPKKVKLSYMEQREFDSMEQKVLKAEAALEAAQTALADPAIASDGAALTRCSREADRCRQEVDALYERWAVLEEKQKGGGG